MGSVDEEKVKRPARPWAGTASLACVGLCGVLVLVVAPWVLGAPLDATWQRWLAFGAGCGLGFVWTRTLLAGAFETDRSAPPYSEISVLEHVLVSGVLGYGGIVVLMLWVSADPDEPAALSSLSMFGLAVSAAFSWMGYRGTVKADREALEKLRAASA